MSTSLSTSIEPVPAVGEGLIGEVSEALQAWVAGLPGAPRVVDALGAEVDDGEEVVFVVLYRVARNADLLAPKRWQRARPPVDEGAALWARPPLYLDLHYLVATHARFRGDAERLLGAVLLRLHEATHLVHRPRRYGLPDGRVVDSSGAAWTPEVRPGVVVEKVSVDLVDDLPLTDAMHLLARCEAPFRPYVTYRARCALEGALVAGVPTQVRIDRVVSTPGAAPPPRRVRPGLTEG